jgi:hypothetical protein
MSALEEVGNIIYQWNKWNHYYKENSQP